jgi:hypothetical protein
MAKITGTKDWLKGSVKRIREHRTVEVRVSAMTVGNEWAQRNKIVAQVDFYRSDGDYRIAYFGEGDVQRILPTFLEAAPADAKLEIVAKILSSLSQTDLVKLIAPILVRSSKKAGQSG